VIQAALHLTAATLLALALGPPPPLILALALLLALAPDLDTPKSLIGRLLQPISVPLERRVGHRTATHSVCALALVSGGAYLLFPRDWLVLVAAYASHIVLDLLIGVYGVMLFWPSGQFLALTAWRDDGPAPRALLLAMLPLLLIAALWPQIGPVLMPTLSSAAAVANPLSTPTLPPTVRPSIRLRLSLPAGVGLSALQVRAGDVITEGQTLAAWPFTEPTPHPSATPPPMPTPPPTPPAPPVESDAARELDAAQAALDALNIEQTAARAALLAKQQRSIGEQQRSLADAQRALDQLLLEHELEQQAAQLAVDQADQVLIDAQDAQALADPVNLAAVQRAAEHVHDAEAALRKALNGQESLRTEQGIARQQAEADLAAAQADLDALPDQQTQTLATLDAEDKAATILASNRVERANIQVEEARLTRERAQEHAAVTAATLAQAHQLAITATTQAHLAAMTATAAAIPTPAPSHIVSRANGRIVSVAAEEQDGRLIVTLEVMP
jgi:membrane-bound metal-dependent hydrolase YbcI (DUF457 family)